jgi:HK97 family phage major capsid protein|nr:MAG TPA: major capsid protein [Caudoviricetes sp.]
MKNKDMLAMEKAQILQKMNAAIQGNDSEAFAKSFEELSMNIQENIMNEAGLIRQQADASILAARGVRQLTSEENEYYQKVIEAMKSSNPKQALTDLDVTLPKTTIDAIFEDLITDHPLLDAIQFQNTSGLIEMLLNANGVELATWGTLTAEITKELTSGFKKVNMSLSKLSAFLPVAKSMLDLGPAWLDRYTRDILSEALANGLESGIIAGTGKDMPIGMNRQVGEGVTVTGGVYPEKTTVAVTSLDPVSYGALLAKLAKGPNGKTRKINNVIMIINPVDYFKKVMPATTIRTPDGAYVNNVLPYPTLIIQSAQIAEGKAIIGLGKRYFMGIGTAKSGKIEFSDEYKFLEDERVYLVKLYGHGEPLDNDAFIYADISGLTPLVQEVKVVGTVATKEQA